MGFFDFFKKKKEPKIEDIVGSIMSQVFPNGKSQIQSIASSLYKEFGGKYPIDSLMKSIAYCGSMLITAQDKSSQRVVERGLLLKPDNRYSKEDAITLYKAVVKSYFSSKIGIDNNEAFDAFYKSLGNVGDSVEIINNRIKGATGIYGLSVNNPVPIKGVQASYTFLDKLLTSKGEPIQYKRLGSFSSSIIKELIDGYAVTDNLGHSLGTIYICGYCNVENPEPPTGFIIKGMPIQRQIPKPVIKPASPVQTVGAKPSASVTTTQRPTTLKTNGFNPNRTIPTLINPPGIETLMKRAKRADLGSEIDEVFTGKGISIKYSQKIDIDKLHDVFNDYTKCLKTSPLFESLIESNQLDYVTENIKHFFKLGIAVYLVNNEYGNYIGRWSDSQYDMFMDSVKSKSFTMYYDMLESFDNCERDVTIIDACFSSTANRFLTEYKDECIKEINAICRASYYAGFRYSLVKFGDEFLRQGITEKDFGTFKLSQNICNALSHGYKNNHLAKEEFEFDETIASQYKDVADKICKYILTDLFDDKKFYTAISNGVSASIHVGIEAVLNSLRSNITTFLTEEKFKELTSNKDFVEKYPFLKKSDIVGFQCEITNGSNILNVKDNSLKEVKMRDLCADAFLLGMTIALQNAKDKIIKAQNFSREITNHNQVKSSRREELAKRLQAMANDPAMKTVERSEGAMCYSISMPEEETYRCDHCGCNYKDTPENGVQRYFQEIRKMGYDCKLERWCKDCCVKQGLEVSNYTKSRFVFFIRLDSSEAYRITAVYSYHLQVLYQFLKNENMYSGGFGRTEFVGESTEIVEKLLGIKLEK